MNAPALHRRGRLSPRLAASILIALVVLQAAGVVALGSRVFGAETPAVLTRSPLALALAAGVAIVSVALFALGRASAAQRLTAPVGEPMHAEAPAADVAASSSAGEANVTSRSDHATPASAPATPRPTAAVLPSAVDAGELRLFLQPRISLADTGIVGAEALVRWQHPQHGLLLPADFLDGTDPNLPSRPLTLWVLEEAARRWEALRHDGVPLRLSLNLSANDLFDSELPAQLGAVLARHQVPAQAFCLDVAEVVVAAHPARAAAALHTLAGHGFRLAVDGFGAGASSVAHLAGLPLQELKLDRSLVHDLDRDAAHARTVRALVRLAHDLGLKPVAVGIENVAIWQRLREWQCSEGQGLHIGAPRPADELPGWCQHWRQAQAAAAAPVLSPD